MKARVKATGEIIEVNRLRMSSQGDIWQEKSGKEYFVHELDFDVKEPPKPQYDPDYWTRLEHQYAGMAMQAYIIASHISQFSFCEGDMKDCKSMAHALVEKMKEKEERK